jgi:hypothetical protein
MDKVRRKCLIAAVLLLLAVVSCLYVGDWASDPKTHEATISELDGKVQTVMALTAGATGAAVVVSMLPQDMATPVAEELADIASYFLIVLCALYAEKYLVSILGLASFRILIPAALAVLGVGLFWKPERLRPLAIKLAAVGLAIFLVIPASLKVSAVIDRTLESSMRETVSAAEEFRREGAEAEENGGLLDAVIGTVRKYRDEATSLLNRYLQNLAMLIVTSCVIPLLVLFFFLWLLKQFTGVDLAGRFRRAAEARRGRKPKPEGKE